MSNETLTERIQQIANAYEEIRLTAQQVVVANQHLIEEIFISMIRGGHLLSRVGNHKDHGLQDRPSHRHEFRRQEPSISAGGHHRGRVYEEENEFVKKGRSSNFLMVDGIRLTPGPRRASRGDERAPGDDRQDHPPARRPYFVIATRTPSAEGTFPYRGPTRPVHVQQHPHAP